MHLVLVFSNWPGFVLTSGAQPVGFLDVFQTVHNITLNVEVYLYFELAAFFEHEFLEDNLTCLYGQQHVNSLKRTMDCLSLPYFLFPPMAW